MRCFVLYQCCVTQNSLTSWVCITDHEVWYLWTVYCIWLTRLRHLVWCRYRSTTAYCIPKNSLESVKSKEADFCMPTVSWHETLAAYLQWVCIFLWPLLFADSSSKWPCTNLILASTSIIWTVLSESTLSPFLITCIYVHPCPTFSLWSCPWWDDTTGNACDTFYDAPGNWWGFSAWCSPCC